MKSLCITTPIKQAIMGPSHVSVVDLAVRYTEQGGKVHHKTTWLASNLAEARGKLLEHALQTGAERILMVDDDIVFSAEDALTLIALDRGDDIVSGLYKAKIEDGACIGDPLESSDGALLEMRRIGLGFALFTRNCLERMVSAHGGGAFEFLHDGTRMLGEDEVFCDRWRALGGRIWMHIGIRLGHIGAHIFR